ncbi:MAG: hypothetical protein PHQ74_06295 [Crocinitomicaceae bacterium]|nr:hypothetical protein [Crocinitomicaceae bacterium]
MNSDKQLIQENKQDFLSKLDLKLVLAIFIGLLSTLFFIKNQNILLDQNTPFTIGVATANEIDVASRIGLTYKTLFVGIFTALCSYFIFKKWISLSFLKMRENTIKGIVLIQIVLSLSILVDIQKSNSFWLLNTILFCLIAISLLPKKIQDSYFSNKQLLIAFVQLIALYLVVGNWWITVVIVFILNFAFAHLNSIYQSLFNLWVTLLPLTLFLGVEATMIANQRGIFSSSFLPGIILFNIGIFGFLWSLRKRISRMNLIHLQLPIVVIGYVLFQYYAPIQNWHEEFFETANELNPLMLNHLYAKIPFTDYLSSHLVSDYFWQSIYVFFNDLNYTQDPSIYKGFIYISSALVLYFFVKNTFSNAILAFGIILFLPFLQLYLPYRFAFAFIPFIFLLKYFETENFKHLIYTAISTVILCFWRVDLGISIVVGIAIIMPFVFWDMRMHRKKIVFLLTVLASLGLLIIGLIHFSNPTALPQMAHYFSGSQAHGYERLTPEFSNLFYINFIFLPLSIGVIFVLLLIKISEHKKSVFFYPLLFLIGFYFMNLQRGLVRHSFMEQNETTIASIAWIILILYIYHFTQLKKGWILVALIPGGMLLSIRSIDFHSAILNKNRTFTVKDLPALQNQKIERTVGGQNHEIWELVTFLKQNLKKDETFIDLANAPMLYYYSQKNVPSYFAQYMQNTIDGFLQEENIRQLKNYKIPYVVFSRQPAHFFDNMDGIPNAVRHYRITEYIYKNYQPYKVIGGFQIWISREKKLPADNQNLFELNDNTKIWNLGLNAYFWKPEKQQKWGESKSISFESRSFTLENVASDDFLSLKLKSNEDQTLVINQANASDNQILMKWVIELKKGNHGYILPIGCSYEMRLHEKVEFELHYEKPIEIESIHLKKLNIEY